MNIQIIRIDDRLIHGQVVVGWCPALEIRKIVVVNDAVAGSRKKSEMMSLGVPAGIRALFVDVVSSPKAFEVEKDDARTMVLFENPTDVLRYVQAGGKATSVNVGGMHYADGKTEIHNGYFATDKDLEAFQALAAQGVTMEIRALPGQNPVSLNALLQKGHA